MRAAFWAIFLLGVCNLVDIVNSAPGKKQSSKLKPFELDDILKRRFPLRAFSGVWLSDNEILLQQKEGLVTMNVETQKETVFLGSDILAKWNGSYPTMSPDRKRVLFKYDAHSVFRHSTTAKCDIYDIETKLTTQLESNERLQLCVWSPTGAGVAYVYKNDIYYWDGSETHRLTTGGREGVEYFGIPDWVYEEEVLQEDGALWFSPDGKKLAIGQFDDTDVRTYSFPFYSNPSGNREVFLYPEELHLKYPKPGSPNPKVYLKVRDLEWTGAESWIELKAPVDVVSEDHILQSVSWIDNENVLAIWMNRRQNISSIQKCSSKGVCQQVTKLEEPNGWIVISKPRCYSEKNSCMFTFWIDNWLQIWELDLDTGNNRLGSFGNFTVISVYGRKDNDIFYVGTVEHHPEQRSIYKNKECLSCSIQDLNGIPCTYASASFSKDFSYYALTCTGPGPYYTLVYRTNDQKLVIDWERNNDTVKLLGEYQEPPVHYVPMKLPSGDEAAVKLLLPPEINLEDTGSVHKYPMIVYVYGGPNSVRVTSAFSVGFEKYLSTKRKVIYAQIDGRGSGNKGKSMLFTINNRLGTVEVEDQLWVTKKLVEKFQFIDPERVGIWGWSYGGYATAMAISNDTEHVFQCGISVAPVTSWIYYDTIYTERYMGLPTDEDNLKHYLDGDVTRNIEQFKSHDYMLIHGTGDDNVHYQQSLALAKALQLAGILFEQVSYPDEDHSLGGVQPHLYHTMDQFWGNCLNIEEEDE